ncbi:MAG TPA: glycosyltransferase [Bryobacteraceae bacterium]|nr:glycosyltransferase [Bryobacteraceae bacterium]
MRVAIDAVGIRAGGGEALLRDFLRWLPIARPEWEWKVYMLPARDRFLPDPAAHPRREIEHAELGAFGLGRFLWLLRGLPKRLRLARADVLFSFANTGALGGNVPQVTYLQQSLAFPAGRKIPGTFLYRLRLDILRALVLRGASKSAYLIVQTEDMRRRVAVHAPRLSSRLKVIPGCVAEVEQEDEIRAEKRAQIDLSGWPRLVYIANAAIQKNHAALMRAIPLIAARFPKACLLITLDEAPVTAHDKNYIEPLRALTTELGIRRHVVWLGMLRRSEVRYALRNSTLAVYPSVEESFGLPLAEAIVEGCPLAASDLPYARDVAGQAAVYFDPASPASIASVVIETVERPEKLIELRTEQARRAARFNPLLVAEQIAQCLESALQ